jgi:hypothetical protein
MTYTLHARFESSGFWRYLTTLAFEAPVDKEETP